jgi:hypothetical protein
VKKKKLQRGSRRKPLQPTADPTHVMDNTGSLFSLLNEGSRTETPCLGDRRRRGIT